MVANPNVYYIPPPQFPLFGRILDNIYKIRSPYLKIPLCLKNHQKIQPKPFADSQCMTHDLP